MTPMYLLQFLLFSLGIYSFSILTYLVLYYDLLSSIIFNDIQSEYDYIIVGSGTAGSLIAQRLAQETSYSFIVLEAGGKGHPFHDIPVFGPLLHNSVFDWNYETVPQKDACLAMKESKCKLTQGKILGGSSKLNNMIHSRGNLSHYVQWFHGKYTEKYIKNQFEFIESEVFKLDNLQYKSEFSEAVINAAKELNYQLLGKDFDIGFKKSTLTQHKGKRFTVSQNVPKEYISLNVLVEKLIFNQNICIGVQVLSPKRIKIMAKKAVIVSAGTYNSPKILQLSGVGPRELLNSLDIPVLKDLPVGKNLQDHIGTGLDLVLFDKPQSVGMFDVMNLWNTFKYFYYGTGPYTTPGCEIIGFISTKNETIPDLQYMVLPVGISSDRGSHLRKVLKIKGHVFDKYFAKSFDKYSTTFLALLLHPKSKGEVRIHSRDPNIAPFIDPKYLSHKEDLKIIIDGVKMIRKFLETISLKAIGAHLNNIPFPGCENFEFFSEPYLECYVRHLTLTSFHPVGTCAMGLPDSKDSVVDTSFRVIGIDNLYVVDGSVLPTLPSANINSAIGMMANIFVDNNVIINKQYFCDNISLKEFLLMKCSSQ